MFKIIFFIFSILLFLGCESTNSIVHKPSVSGMIVDNENWYDDANNEYLTMKVDIPNPNSSLCAPSTDILAPLRPCTLEDINNDTDLADDYEPELDVHMSTDTFNNENLLNATMEVRGGYSRTFDTKSYSIKLQSSEDLFLQQRKFQLNKHRSDEYRVKNKLAFDLFRNIPNITSLKLQFIELIVDNNLSYGLYTHAEAIRKEYLVNRGWNEDDNLYNVANFSFETSEDFLTDSSGKPLREDLFNDRLEIKRGENHSKVSQMLKAIEVTKDIDQVISKYFNRDNYITWLAINLVLGNKDTTYHNFYLYNPQYSNVFYFLPWDYDGGWDGKEYLSKSEYGISVWWEVILHRKFLSVDKNRNDVYLMADNLRNTYITDEKIQEKLDLYENVLSKFEGEDWRENAEELVTKTENNMNLYKDVIGHPMPFQQYASYKNEVLTLSWDKSIDFEGDSIVYDVNISKDVEFSTTIFNQSGIVNTTLDITTLTSGTYYLKVISREVNNAQHWQNSYNQVFIDDGVLTGISEIVIP